MIQIFPFLIYFVSNSVIELKKLHYFKNDSYTTKIIIFIKLKMCYEIDTCFETSYRTLHL